MKKCVLSFLKTGTGIERRKSCKKEEQCLPIRSTKKGKIKEVPINTLKNVNKDLIKGVNIIG